MSGLGWLGLVGRFGFLVHTFMVIGILRSLGGTLWRFAYIPAAC